MDNKKQPKPQELSAQELAEIAGGAAEYQPGKYPADSIYDTAKEAISKKITDKVSGYYNDDSGVVPSPNQSPPLIP
ncbi:hypothetical protein C7B65_14775 [Phormidesmis priestleyi ULC007]|uniref:Bacteriocin n=1 Tax=Phormidesmis priestleyi ULC007 TaxID=1920490 RepID=A0A2T1DDJ5_9CYAN|nr:hypothetical protein [Phormidesmis priestleyi]PSB18559.1 hypothetical protein C7B65_14775 [Phormidesmis priestleyi ULC007]PZO49792.1 MAG: hypothetical protein DCF14_13305 [Phormidesmis priestleyi]